MITFCRIIIELLEIFFLGAGNFCLIHVSLVPVLNVVGEQVILRNLWLHTYRKEMIKPPCASSFLTRTRYLVGHCSNVMFAVCRKRNRPNTVYGDSDLWVWSHISWLVAARRLSSLLLFSLLKTQMHTRARAHKHIWFFVLAKLKVLYLQALDENVKVKLSQFCHVPVSDHTEKWVLQITWKFFSISFRVVVFYLTENFQFFRERISSLCMTFPTFGTFLCSYGYFSSPRPFALLYYFLLLYVQMIISFSSCQLGSKGSWSNIQGS